MAIIGDGRRVADVVATSPMTIFAMFGTSFRELEAARPAVAEGSDDGRAADAPSA